MNYPKPWEKENANQTIRKYMAVMGFQSDAVAAVINIAPNTLCRWLQRPLSGNRRVKVLNAFHVLEQMRKEELKNIDLSNVD